MSTATHTLTAILIALSTTLTPHLAAADTHAAPSAPITSNHQQAGVGGSLDPESLARVLGEQQALQDAQDAAQQAEAERLEQERADAERAAQEATEQAAREPVPVEVEPPVEPVVAPVAPPVLTQTEVAHQTLAGLPGSDEISLAWDVPELQGHAGAVWRTSDPERGSVIMLTRSKLDEYGYAADVVRHEIFHVYQNRAIFNIQATEGVDWSTAEARLIERLDSVYGPGLGLEHSADCGARQAFGATWTHYTSTCPAGSEAVTHALIASQGTW